MKSFVTPGVYVSETNAFSKSVTEVSTSVPAFVGWTERAEENAQLRQRKPVRISSLAEYHEHFGGSPTAQYARFSFSRINAASSHASFPTPLSARDAMPIYLGSQAYSLSQTGHRYLLYYSVRHFFMNGGSDCYIISVGTYGAGVNVESLNQGLQTLASEAEPSLVVVPEAVLLSQHDCYQFQSQMLEHCAMKRNRFAIFDVWEGYRARSDAPDVVSAFRDGIVDANRSYGAAYYPWLNTSIVDANEVTYRNLADEASFDTLIGAIKGEPLYSRSTESKRIAFDDVLLRLKLTQSDQDAAALHRDLSALSSCYVTLRTELARRLNVLPPSAAIAGVYSTVDQTRGVWKAPANVSLNAVLSPAVSIMSDAQEDLNVTSSGKSINAIRACEGTGVLVWGARTLDGNGLDWRYVNVRRTLMMIEASIRVAMKAYVFEPNTVQTWTVVKAMIDDFLLNLWRRGAMSGATPNDAFSVQIGLGVSMTEHDVTSGRLCVNMLVAMMRPAEFIELALTQQQQST
jgi:uncharacterized protein